MSQKLLLKYSCSCTQYFNFMEIPECLYKYCVKLEIVCLQVARKKFYCFVDNYITYSTSKQNYSIRIKKKEDIF